jgi:hypothetical protein
MSNALQWVGSIKSQGKVKTAFAVAPSADSGAPRWTMRSPELIIATAIGCCSPFTIISLKFRLL